VTDSNPPGWYPDPVDPATQRYWDGEGWVGPSLPVDATPPAAPPAGPLATTTLPAAGSGPAPTQPPPPPGTPGPTIVPGPDGPILVPPGYALPAAMPHGIPLASPGTRLVARLIDIGAVLVLALIANSWFLYQLGKDLAPIFAESYRGVQPVISEEVGGHVQTLVTIVSVVTAAVWLAYEVPAVAGTGQTPGKRALGIKVMRIENTERLGVGRALRRWITLGLPTLLWTCCCVGFVMQFLDCLYVAVDRRLHQAMHDRSAQTVVVHVGRTRKGQP